MERGKSISIDILLQILLQNEFFSKEIPPASYFKLSGTKFSLTKLLGMELIYHENGCEVKKTESSNQLVKLN